MIMTQLVRFRPQLRIGLVLLTIASVITISAIYAQRSYGFDQDLGKLNRFVQNKGNTASMQIFREGRDFIEAQNW